MNLTEGVNLLPVLARKYVRRAARRSLTVRDHRLRPETCARILGVPEVSVLNFGPKTFAQARQNWIARASEARINRDEETEKAYNIAWSRLKDWRCPVCGGVKPRTRAESCSRQCGNELRKATRRRKLGPIVLRYHPRSGRLNGRSYRGHGLRAAQVKALQEALERSGHCVAASARDLGMSYGLIKYYLRKFGGYIDGKRARLTPAGAP